MGVVQARLKDVDAQLRFRPKKRLLAKGSQHSIAP